MEKTININLSGLLFRVEEKAYSILKEYLLSVTNRFKNIEGGSETVEDIELRIAEIFLSKKGKDGIISQADVEEMISLMGKPEDYTDNDEVGGSAHASPIPRKLYRDPDEAIIAGVASGLGAYLRIDPVWMRLIFIITTFVGGAGFFAYLLFWAVLPPADTEGRKRELYGDEYMTMTRRRAKGADGASNSPADNLARALNSFFTVIGKIVMLFIRIVVAIVGVAFLLAGFSALVAAGIILFFNSIPLFAGSIDPLIFDLRSFIGIIVSPGSVTFIIILLSLIIMLPLLAMIYWGVRMIFQFRVRDGIFNLAMFLVWLLVLVTFAFVSAAHGLNFNDRARAIETTLIAGNSDTLYLSSNDAYGFENLKPVFEIPDSDGPDIYINPDDDQIFGTPRVTIRHTDDENNSIEIRKYSSSSTNSDSHLRAESIIYQYRFDDNRITLDPYYSLPLETRFRAEHVRVILHIKEGTTIWIDDSIERNLGSDRYGRHYAWQMGGKYWTMNDGELQNIVSN